MIILSAISTTATSVLLILGAVLAILGFIGYLYILVATKKHTPEEIVRKFKKGKPAHNASGLIDMWGAITLGIAMLGLLSILLAVIFATKI